MKHESQNVGLYLFDQLSFYIQIWVFSKKSYIDAILSDIEELVTHLKHMWLCYKEFSSSKTNASFSNKNIFQWIYLTDRIVFD